MVTFEEIKKAQTMYRDISHIICTNLNTSVDLGRVISFNENDLEIEIETYLHADELQRGWIGNMYYEASYGIDVETCEKVNSTYEKRINDVLLARVNSYKSETEGVIFTYTFLKY